MKTRKYNLFLLGICAFAFQSTAQTKKIASASASHSLGDSNPFSNETVSDNLGVIMDYQRFNNEKFNTYVTEIPEHYNPDNSKEQRDIMRKLNLYGLNTCNEETDMLATRLQATGFDNKNYLNIYLIKKL